MPPPRSLFTVPPLTVLCSLHNACSVIERVIALGIRAKALLFVHGRNNVLRQARRHFHRHPTDVPLPDLYEAGMLGLLKAIDHFDPEKGVRLLSYASYWIR